MIADGPGLWGSVQLGFCVAGAAVYVKSYLCVCKLNAHIQNNMQTVKPWSLKKSSALPQKILSKVMGNSDYSLKKN